jgi:hypothetical protein
MAVMGETLAACQAGKKPARLPKMTAQAMQAATIHHSQ